MSGIVITVALHADVLLALDNLTRAIERLATPVPVAEPSFPIPSVAAPPSQRAAASNPEELVWTDQRRAALRREFEKGTAMAAIGLLLRALPGAALPNDNAIATYATVVLDLRRPPPPPKNAATPRPTTRAETLAAVSAAVGGNRAVRTYFGAVRQWAAERGLSFVSRDDLPTVNAKRNQLGLPPFELPAVR